MVGMLGEAVGILQTLKGRKLEDAVTMLRKLSEPGFAYDANSGQMVYSSVFLNDDAVMPQKERLF